jgi:hypothetical protein
MTKLEPLPCTGPSRLSGRGPDRRLSTEPGHPLGMDADPMPAPGIRQLVGKESRHG